MAGIRVTTRYQDQELSAFIKNMPGLRDDYAEHVARQVEFRWRTLAHFLTGAYRQSIYVATHTESEYAGAAVQVQVLRPEVTPLPEVPRPPSGAAIVSCCVPYAVYEELGTARRGPHPAFIPAVEATKANLPSLKEVYKK